MSKAAEETELYRPEAPYEYQCRLARTATHYLLEELDFDKGKKYALLQTIGNPAVAAAMEAQQEQAVAMTNATAEGDISRVCFSRVIVNPFYHALNALLQAEGIAARSMILFDGYGQNGLDNRAESHLWPTTHVLKVESRQAEAHCQTVDRFDAALDQLLGDEAYNVIQKSEAPQNYRLGTIQWVREQKLAPLVMTKKTYFTGEQLAAVANFLLPWKLAAVDDDDGPLYD